jgi:hypothetical protein
VETRCGLPFRARHPSFVLSWFTFFCRTLPSVGAIHSAIERDCPHDVTDIQFIAEGGVRASCLLSPGAPLVRVRPGRSCERCSVALSSSA